MKIRNVKEEDFGQYKNLRILSLEDYQKLTKDELKLSFSQIKNEFKDILANKKRIMFVLEDIKEIKAHLIGTLIKNSYQNKTYIDDIFVKKEDRKKEKSVGWLSFYCWLWVEMNI